MAAPQQIGRYLVFDEIASGGMATVHLGRMIGPAGFARTVAVKRLHPQFAKDPEFVAMFLDEARVAGRIHHPNVVSTLDVVARGAELFLVMDFVHGESLAKLASAASAAGAAPLPPGIAVACITHALYGLHAAHEAKSERGEPLEIVHRDVSPQNLLVGLDGVTRVLDFGIAKAAIRLQSTRDGQIKGKLRYMAPEQLKQEPLDRRVDVYASAMVLWEALTGKRLFAGDDPGAIVTRILMERVVPPSAVAPGVPAAVDEIVMRGLARSAADRFPTAMAMAEALERAAPAASPREVAAWVEGVAGARLRERAERVAEIESSSQDAPAFGIAAALATGMPAGRSAEESDAATEPGDLVSARAARRAAPTRPELGTPPGEGTSTDAQLVTDASHRAPVAPRSGRRVLAAGAALGLVALALLAALALRVVPVEPGTVAGAATGATAAPSAAPSPSAEAAAPRDTAAPNATAASTAAASGDASRPPAGAAAGSASAAPASTAPAPPRAAGPRSAPGRAGGRPRGCEVPYKMVDGIKVWKQECL